MHSYRALVVFYVIAGATVNVNGVTEQMNLTRLLDDSISEAFMYTDITFNSNDVVVSFSGDESSSIFTSYHILIGNENKELTEIQILPNGDTTVKNFSAPYQLQASYNDVAVIQIANWTGSVTLDSQYLPTSPSRYAMAVTYPSSDGTYDFVCSYALSNSAISLPDIYVLDLFKRIGVPQ